MKRYSVGALGAYEVEGGSAEAGLWVPAEVAREMYEALKLALPLHEDSGYMHTAELIRSVLAKAEARND